MHKNDKNKIIFYFYKVLDINESTLNFYLQNKRISKYGYTQYTLC